MIQCKSSKEYNRENQERRLVYFLFLHTLIFHICWCITLTSLSILLPRLITSLPYVSDGYWYTHCGFYFVYIFLFWKLCIHSSAMSKDVSEACGSICLLREKQRFLQMVETASFILYNRRHCYCYFVITWIVQLYTFSARWSNLEHNLPFTLWDWQFVYPLI